MRIFEFGWDLGVCPFVLFICAKARASLSAPSQASVPVAKEGTVKPGDFGQQPGEFRLVLVEEKIRNMNQPARLTLDRRLDRRVVVAERVDSDSTQEIQIPLAV